MYIIYLQFDCHFALCAGYVSFPDEHGEDLHAEVFAVLRGFAWTPSMTKLFLLLFFILFFLLFPPCLSIWVEYNWSYDKTVLFVPLQITRQERTLMKPFYDRYRLLKQMVSSASTAAITTIVSYSSSKYVFGNKTLTIFTERISPFGKDDNISNHKNAIKYNYQPWNSSVTGPSIGQI